MEEKRTVELADSEMLIGARQAIDVSGATAWLQFLIVTMPPDLIPLPK